MTPDEEPLKPGEFVIYTPFPGAAQERGVVTSLSGNPTIAFVRYHTQPADAPGKATRIADLKRDTRVQEVVDDLKEKIAEAVEPYVYSATDTVEVVTRYGGHRHYAWDRNLRGERNGLGDGGRHFTLCRSTSSWTLESWRATPDHPLGLTVEAMAELPLCPACVAVKASGR